VHCNLAFIGLTLIYHPATGGFTVSLDMFLKVTQTLIYSKPSSAFSSVVFASATTTLSIVIESPFASAASPIPYTFASSFFELSDVVLPPVGVELSDGDSPSQAAREIIIISVREPLIKSMKPTSINKTQ
jgi:hypothetical protein